jgi:hypothetical protein
MTTVEYLSRMIDGVSNHLDGDLILGLLRPSNSAQSGVVAIRAFEVADSIHGKCSTASTRRDEGSNLQTKYWA